MYVQAISALLEASDNFTQAELAGNDFTKLGIENGRPMLGWVSLPSREDIQIALQKILSTQFMSDRTRFLFFGTGGWIHAVNIVRELGASSNWERVIGLRSLDLAASIALPARRSDLQQTTCIGISLTRTTLETLSQREILREYFTLAGLDFEEHFIWLTSIENERIASTENSFSVTVSGRADIGALFSGPSTLAMLLPMALLLEEELFDQCYRELVENRERLLDKMAKRAYQISQNPGSALWFRTRGTRNSSLEFWILQLVRQALGSKTSNSPSNILVGQEINVSGFEIIELDTLGGNTSLTRAIQSMYACQIFVACLAYWWKIPFVTHPEVDRYKKLVPKLLDSFTETPPFEFYSVEGANIVCLEKMLIERLSLQTEYKFVEIVIYDTLTFNTRWRLEESLHARTKLHCRVYEGSDWNHHSFQFAIANQQTLVIIVEVVASFNGLPVSQSKMLNYHARTLRSMARATHIALGNLSLFIQWHRDNGK